MSAARSVSEYSTAILSPIRVGCEQIVVEDPRGEKARHQVYARRPERVSERSGSRRRRWRRGQLRLGQLVQRRWTRSPRQIFGVERRVAIGDDAEILRAVGMPATMSGAGAALRSDECVAWAVTNGVTPVQWPERKRDMPLLFIPEMRFYGAFQDCGGCENHAIIGMTASSTDLSEDAFLSRRCLNLVGESPICYPQPPDLRRYSPVRTGRALL